MDPTKPQSAPQSERSLAREIAAFAESLALRNALDISLLARVNARRFRANGPALDHWNELKAGLKAFLNHALRNDYPVRLLRNQLPTKAITSSRDPDFLTFARDVIRTLNSLDGRTAYWFQKKIVIYRIFIDIPFTSADESLASARRKLLNLSRGVSDTPHSVSEASRTGTQDSSQPDSSQPDIKEHIVGATFDLVGPESLKRYIFQYWVYNTDTDEIAAEGSFIAKGDTVQEATRHLMDGLRSRLGPSATPSLKVHVKMLDKFEKQPASSAKSLAEQFVDAVRDEIKRETPKP